MSEYRTWETSEHLLGEHRAADRIAQHWRGRVIPAPQYETYDRILSDIDGSTAALVEIKVRTYSIDFFIEHLFMLSRHKVRSLTQAARQKHAVPLVLVVCADDDFMLDLRDESGMRIETRRTWGNHADSNTGERLHHVEEVCLFSGSRFLPLFTLPRLL